MTTRASGKWIAAGSVLVCATVLWPGPAGAASTLGGYTASVDSSVVHIEMYEPVFPVPSSPQGDFSIGYAQSTAQSGTTRALASYLWPGSVIGDGFDQITSQPGTSYPVQVDSRYPATQQAPKANRAQLTKGNGMQTYADPDQARATTSGLGIHAPDTNPTAGAGAGLGQLITNQPAPGGGSGAPLPLPSSSAPPALPAPSPSGGGGKPAKPPKSPVPVPVPLADLATVHGMTSTANIDARGAQVISTGRASAAEVDLLGGIITLKGLQVDSRIVSNGKHALNVGRVSLTGLVLAGHPIDLGKHGLTVTGKKAPLPAVPAQVTAGLKQLGISFAISPAKQSTNGPAGTYSAQAMTVTVNTAVLRGKLDGPVNAIDKQLPSQLSSQLAPLFALRPKLVFKIGETRNNATSAPPYVAAPITTPVTGHGGGPVTGSGGGSTGGLGAVTGGSAGGGTTAGSTTAGGATTGGTSSGGSTGGTAPAGSPKPVALSLPALGTMPRLFILGALVLAGGLGWALQTAGGSLLGGASSCPYGLRKGLPNLRTPPSS